MGLLQCWDFLCSSVTACVHKVYLNENPETLRLFLHQRTHTHKHTHEHVHMHSQQVIRCQNQRLKRYINPRLTPTWSCSSCHPCQVCGEPAACRVTVQMLIKSAIRALVVLQFTAGWIQKRKKHIVIVGYAFSLHSSICALSRKRMRTDLLYIQKRLSSAFIFGKACIKVRF